MGCLKLKGVDIYFKIFVIVFIVTTKPANHVKYKIEIISKYWVNTLILKYVLTKYLEKNPTENIEIILIIVNLLKMELNSLEFLSVNKYFLCILILKL